ncbi:hypothetical protein DFM81_000860 [Clostridium beijerinckii]|nr:hypothetical protein [Clostridium beijerinckii]
MNNPRIMIIGDTFLLSNHIQRSVINNPTNPGINESKLFCNVVTLVSVNDIPDACCNRACLTPSAPAGSLLQSINAPSLNLTDDTTGANLTDTHLLTNDPKMNIPRIDAPFVISCSILPDKSSLIRDPAL